MSMSEGSIFMGGGSVSFGGGGVSIINGVVHASSSSGGSIVIDGEQYSFDEIRASKKGGKDKSESKKKDEAYSKSWLIVTETLPKRVQVQGSSGLDFHGETIHDSPVLTISGSGRIQLAQYQLKKVSATVTGSGSIDLGESTVQEVVAQVTGSGDVKSFTAVKVGRFTVTGSGDITGSAVRGCDVDKSKTGSGSIRIR